MDKGKESTFLLQTWSLLFLLLPLELPVLAIKNSLLVPFWNSIFQLLTNNKIYVFSDSAGFLGIITIVLLLSALLFISLRKWIFRYEIPYVYTLKLFLIGGLFLVFLKYGLDKIMHLQFPKPEPNVLLTPFGKLDKDLLFWSTMGTSYLHNFATGAGEIIAAFFLLFRRTRRLGLLLLLLMAAYVVLLNFSFNIGVKMFSVIILLTLLSLNWNTLSFLYTYFLSFGEEKNQAQDQRIFLPLLKSVAACSMLALLFMNNKDNTIKNNLQGAYVMENTSKQAFVYINQQNYWIEQSANGNKNSYEILFQGAKILRVRDSSGNTKEFEFFENESGKFQLNENNTVSYFEKIDLSKWPASRDNFSFIVD